MTNPKSTDYIGYIIISQTSPNYLIEYSNIFGVSGFGSESFFFVFRISSENQKNLKIITVASFQFCFRYKKCTGSSAALDYMFYWTRPYFLTHVTLTWCLSVAVSHLTCPLDVWFIVLLLSSLLPSQLSGICAISTPSTTNNRFIHWVWVNLGA